MLHASLNIELERADKTKYKENLLANIILVNFATFLFKICFVDIFQFIFFLFGYCLPYSLITPLSTPSPRSNVRASSPSITKMPDGLRSVNNLKHFVGLA